MAAHGASGTATASSSRSAKGMQALRFSFLRRGTGVRIKGCLVADRYPPALPGPVVLTGLGLSLQIWMALTGPGDSGLLLAGAPPFFHFGRSGLWGVPSLTTSRSPRHHWLCRLLVGFTDLAWRFWLTRPTGHSRGIPGPKRRMCVLELFFSWA